MDDINKHELLKYRLEQAKETVKEAQLLYNNNMYRAATNRIYYGMFYAVTALALMHNFETSKHQQLIGWFNQQYIKSGIIEKKYAAYLKEAFEFRQQGDYATFTVFEAEEVF